MSSGAVLCVGEPLVVLSPPPDASLEVADALSVSVGGAEANVAVHLARLGVAARFAGAVGDDPFGRRVRSLLHAEGVDVSALETRTDLPTGLYAKDPSDDGTVAYYYRRGSAMSVADHLPAGALEGVTRVHVTGITASLGRGCAAIVDELLGGAVPVSFDVNHRAALWADAKDDAGTTLLGLARRAGLVFVGLDEAAGLWGCADATSVRELLPGGELVVKDAERPAAAFRGEQRVDVAALPVPVVEPVGAGDAFAAGYLSARGAGGDLARALRTGHAVAATALSTNGDQGDGPDPELLRAAATGEGWPDVGR